MLQLIFWMLSGCFFGMAIHHGQTRENRAVYTGFGVFFLLIFCLMVIDGGGLR